MNDYFAIQKADGTRDEEDDDENESANEPEVDQTDQQSQKKQKLLSGAALSVPASSGGDKLDELRKKLQVSNLLLQISLSDLNFIVDNRRESSH